MTEEEYNAYVGKLCQDKDNPHIKYMVYDLYHKLNHKGGMFPAYRFIRMDSGLLGEAPCSLFFDISTCVIWLTP
jgi:hypothetical protein